MPKSSHHRPTILFFETDLLNAGSDFMFAVTLFQGFMTEFDLEQNELISGICPSPDSSEEIKL